MARHNSIGKSGAEPTHKKGVERHRAILRAARAKLIEYGVGGLVLREIAEDLGITHGNLQYYFKTKHDLLYALYDRELARYTDGMKEAVAAASTRSGKVSAIIDAGFEQLMSDETKLWRILQSLAQENTTFRDMLKTLNEGYDQALAEEIEKFSPSMPWQRRVHIAKIVRLILDGTGVDFIFTDPRSPDIIGLKSEIKVLLTELLSIS